MSSADGGPVVNAMAERLQPVLVLVGVIWAVEIVNLLTGHVLVSWGILPRSLSGLIGIPLAPGRLWEHPGPPGGEAIGRQFLTYNEY